MADDDQKPSQGRRWRVSVDVELSVRHVGLSWIGHSCSGMVSRC